MGTSSRTIVRLEAIKRVDKILAGMTCDGSFTGSVLIAQDENILLSKGYTTGSFSLK